MAQREVGVRYGVWVFVALVFVGVVPRAAAGGYAFDVFHRQGDVIDGVPVGLLRFEADTLTLNNAGEALFLSRVSDPNNPFRHTLHTGSRVVARVGQPLAGRTLTYIEPASVSLNNGGAVAFIANHAGGSPSVYLNGAPVLEAGTQLGADLVTVVCTDGLGLADNGNLAAYAEVNGTAGVLNTGTRAVITGGGVVARVGQTVAGTLIRRMNWDSENVTVNIDTDSSGRVGFYAAQGASGGHDTLFTQDRVLSPFTSGANRYVADFRTVAFNDRGDFAFAAREDTPAGSNSVVVVNGAVVARDGVTGDGRPYDVTASGALELNEAGSVAFFYSLAEPNQTSSQGLSVDGELLLRVGDVVDGYAVTRIHPNALGFNDLGETLFIATLRDGGGATFDALVRGAPVPEPGFLAVGGVGVGAVLVRRWRGARGC